MPPRGSSPAPKAHDRRVEVAGRRDGDRAGGVALLPQGAQHAPHEHVEPLQAQALGDQVAQERLRDLERRPLAVGRRRRQDPALDHPPDDAPRRILVGVEDPGPTSVSMLREVSWKMLMYCSTVTPSVSDRLIEHRQAVGQSLRPVAVDAKGAKQQVEPPRHRPQSIAVERAQLLVGDDPLEERAGEGLQAEGQAGRLEAVLAVRAVHARDADRDVALQVDVLERLDRPGAQDDLLEPLEDREEQLQGRLGLVPPEGLLQRRDQVGVHPSELTQPMQRVGVVERVLAPDLPPHAEEEGDLLAPDRIGVGELGEAGVDIRRLRARGRDRPRPRSRPGGPRPPAGPGAPRRGRADPP